MKKLRSNSDTDFERLFSGKAPKASSDLDEVARFVDGVQNAYLNGPDPDLEATHLTGLMKVVHLTDKGELVARPASKANGPGSQASGLPKRRRRIMLETLFGSIAAKIAAGGIAVALASTSGLAATGNLPDDMQTGISEAVEKIGINIPLGETASAELEAEVDAEGELDADGEAEGELDGDAGVEDEQAANGTREPNENADFGQSVAEDAQDGGVDGQEISERAREMAEQRKAQGQAHRPDHVSDDASDSSEEGDGSQQGVDPAGDTPAANFLPGNASDGSDSAGPPAGQGGRPEAVPGGRP